MKTFTVMCLVAGMLAFTISPASAYVYKEKDPKTGEMTVEKGGPDHPSFAGASLGAGLGAAITILGAGLGLGRIGASALESMARQPEVAGRIQTGMIIIAALLEGVTFFSLIVCIIVAGKAIW